MTSAYAHNARTRTRYTPEKKPKNLMSPELPSVVSIDLSHRSIRLTRRQVRELLKQVAALCCGAPAPVTLRSSLSLLQKCLGDPRKAPELAALLEFAKLSAGDTSVSPATTEHRTDCGSSSVREAEDLPYVL